MISILLLLIDMVIWMISGINILNLPIAYLATQLHKDRISYPLTISLLLKALLSTENLPLAVLFTLILLVSVNKFKIWLFIEKWSLGLVIVIWTLMLQALLKILAGITKPTVMFFLSEVVTTLISFIVLLKLIPKHH